MPREPKITHFDSDQPQFEWDFNDVIHGPSATVLSRKPTDEHAPEYSPIDQTAEYMRRAVKMEEAWETTIQKAREALLKVDPRDLYFRFLQDAKREIESGISQAERYSKLLDIVALRGLGLSSEYLQVRRPRRGGMRWHVDFNADAIREHISTHIIGEHFLNPMEASATVWGDVPPLVGASDVSQHRSAVPIPARFFKRSVPFVLNNAAGTLLKWQAGRSKFEPIFNPKPDENLIRWMLIDPSYQDDLEPEDYERCIASAMDVGQYKFDLEFLMKSDQPPEIIFRDGSLFPQDAYLDNYILESRRGDFTREAIRDLLSCLLYAQEMKFIYCGVSKNVQLKVYSTIVDWFIAKEIDNNWEVGNYTLNDGQAMSILLASPAFVAENLQQVITTCLIRRSFTTRANLNTRTKLSDIETYFRRYQQREYDINPFRSLCEKAHVYMFFIGHSKSPSQQLPRYEFFYADSLGSVQQVAEKVFAALRYCGRTNDKDHSFMSDKEITYLLPSVTQHAHLLSNPDYS